MGKQLRLAAAALTDVGRRRERNQDYTTHQVPSDEQLLSDKGALFVVCDGMGGYAAGEVASEIAATTIQDIYFKSDDSNTISRIAEAIKSANQAVFNHSREHPETAGMGTTAVVLVIQDGRAYYVNIGDSRGYLLRDGHMRQVTQDHSWVAEQVRAGVLSEEQAQNHPHRNVITRSVGTQPTVSADLFIETLLDGDRLLLCCDGLHGYVDEAEIERTALEATDLDLGVQQLIDLANANGGPDNITAVLVEMLEVPQPLREVEIPSGPPEEQIVTQPMPAIKRGRHAPKRRHPPRTAIVADEKIDRRAARSAGQRTARTVLALVAVLALIALGAGAWDIGFGPYAAARAATAQLNSDVSYARQVAQQSSSQDPATALAALANARQKLLTDIQNPQIDASSVQSAEAVLNGPLAAAVQAAVQHYNQAASISVLPPNSSYPHSVNCTDPAAGNTSASLAAPTAMTAVSSTAASGIQVLYALANGTLYQMGAPVDPGSQQPAAGTIQCDALHLSGVTSATALASDGATLYVLGQEQNGAYEVLAIAPNGGTAGGLPGIKVAQQFGVATSNGAVPAALAAHAGTVYVAYKPGTSGTPGVWVYRGNVSHGPAQTLTLPQPAVALAVVNGSLFGLLDDGSLGQAAADGTWQQIGVQVQSPLTPDDPSLYAAATPVPTVAPSPPSGTGMTQFGSSDTLIPDPALPTHLLVNDGTQNRIIRFIASPTGPGLGLSMQYVYGAPLTNLSPLAVASNGTTLGVYGWSGGNLIAFPIPEPPA